ncbi:hypothetical protein ABZ297_13735 [Nonomuraea sp. NPDC005983]|uniref:hypothetical protein n=1 Tax=Nonomuraea sp. NPDC005983 TaxID=3155595 RepID=UPI0033BEA4FF
MGAWTLPRLGLPVTWPGPGNRRLPGAGPALCGAGLRLSGVGLTLLRAGLGPALYGAGLGLA